MRPTNDIAAPVNELRVHNKINIIRPFAAALAALTRDLWNQNTLA